MSEQVLVVKPTIIAYAQLFLLDFTDFTFSLLIFLVLSVAVQFCACLSVGSYRVFHMLLLLPLHCNFTDFTFYFADFSF